MLQRKLQYQYEIYENGLRGEVPITSTSYADLEEAAREKLPSEAYWYVAGGASTGSTMVANRRAFDRYKIMPRMLAGVSQDDFDMRTTLFGQTVSAPIVVAPIGVQEQLHQEADLATAAAAAKVGVPYTHSSAGSRSLESVAETVKDGVKWYQLVCDAISFSRVQSRWCNLADVHG
jgi:lactate 2-monooxygenase